MTYISVTSQLGLEDHQKGQKHLKKVQGAQGGSESAASGKVQTDKQNEFRLEYTRVYIIVTLENTWTKPLISLCLFRCELCNIFVTSASGLEVHMVIKIFFFIIYSRCFFKDEEMNK